MAQPLVSDALWKRIKPLLPPPQPRRFRFPGRKPLAVTITGSNVHDVKELLNVVDAIPEVRGRVGHPRKRPEELYADRAYDSEPHREKLRQRGIDPKIGRRGTEHGSGLGVYRWVVERTASWLHSFRKLRLRTDRTAAIHEAFVA